MKVVGFVPDLMDRSKFPKSIDMTFVRSVAEIESASADADAVVVDLTRDGALEALAKVQPQKRRIGFVNHTRADIMDAANAQGVETYRRSQFFSQIAEILSDAK